MKTITLLVLLATFTVNAQCWMTADAGTNHVIAIQNDGSVWSWGNSDWDKTSANQGLPVLYTNSSNWSVISAGSNHNLILNSTDKLYGWGANFSGQIGQGTGGTMYPTYNFARQIGTSNWLSFDAGSTYSIAIKSDGTLWVWGENSNGTAGNWTSTFVPVQLGTETDWVSALTGSGRMTALKSNGTIWVWKTNYYQQLGTDSDWAFLSTKYAIKTDGTLWSITSDTTPVQVGTDNDWLKVSSNASHYLALKTNGTLWAWGNNNQGQLGNGTLNFSLSPIQVGTDNNWQTLSVGGEFSLGIKSDGTLWSWGSNSYRQLGNGSLMRSTIPIQIVCAPLDVNENNFSELQIYPNPVKNFLNISGNYITIIKGIAIYDLTGKKVSSYEGSAQDINVSQLERGIYLLKIKTEQNILTYKFIKE